MAPTTDVLIVGAGPAGCVAALVLARAGVRVRLVDREEFPRDKLCGDTLNPGTMSILERLGDGIAAAVRAQALPVTGMIVTGPGGAAVASDYPHGLTGAALARRDLDRLLLDAAIRAGADFTPAVHVREAITGPDGRVSGVRASTGATPVTLDARVVVGADGRRSSLAFGMQLARFAPAPRRWAFGAYFAGVEGLSARGEMHIRNDGYVGVAPLPGGLANVCVVRDLQQVRLPPSRSALQRPGKPDATYDTVRLKPDTTYIAANDSATGDVSTGDVSTGVVSGFSRTVIANAIAADPMLRERFARARQVTPMTSLGPLAVDATAAGCAGLLLAGDAAGFVDPMTGDGMRFALRGGELAAAAALTELQTGAPAFEQLGAARWREFSGKWRVNRTLRALVASPRGVSLAARLTAHWQTPVRMLVGIAGDVRLALRADLDELTRLRVDESEGPIRKSVNS